MLAKRSLLLVLALLLAGCAGAKPNEEPGPSESDPYALPDGVSNMLQGSVVTVDSIPIENATVEVLSLSMTTATDHTGLYSFENLEPRDYIVTVSKEGYRTGNQRAIIEDGKIFDLDFKLEEKPLATPYNETIPFEAFIGCQLAYGTNPETVEYEDCGGAADPNNRVTKDFTIQPNAALAVIEAHWEKKTELAKHLTMAVESAGYGHQDLVFGRVSGPTGLRMPVSELSMRKYYPAGGTLRVTVAAAPASPVPNDYLDMGLAFQQDVEVYVTVFYVEPGPADFRYIQ